MFRRHFLRYLSTNSGSKNQKPLNVADKLQKNFDQVSGKRTKIQVRFFKLTLNGGQDFILLMHYSFYNLIINTRINY